MTTEHLWTRLTATLAITALMCAGLVLATVPQPASAAGYPRSDRIAMVPDASGRQDNGGTLPTSGFLNGYSPLFTNVSIESIRDDAVDPLASSYDTIVLNSVCDIDAFLSDAQFKSRVEGFVLAGGKLLIWDSECTSTDYSKFSIPFQTSNPGAAGAQGTLVDVEENTLSSKDPSSPNFVDMAAVASGTDAVGDANVFTTYDPRWFVDLRATNVLGVNGPAQAYANLGGGLVIYSGLDKDFLPGGSFDPASTDGATHLNRIWLLELLQPWNPDGLPNSTPATGSKCSDVYFVSVRGSGQPGDRKDDDPVNDSPETAKVHSGLLSTVPSEKSVKFIQVDYEAVSVDVLKEGIDWGSKLDWRKKEESVNRLTKVNFPKFMDSVNDGVGQLHAELLKVALECRLDTTKMPQIFLVGYSQGAMVIHEVLADLGRSDPNKYSDLISGVALVSDPERAPKSIAQTRYSTARDFSRKSYGACKFLEDMPGDYSCNETYPPADIPAKFAKRTLAICDDFDIVCDTSMVLNDHGFNPKARARMGFDVHVMYQYGSRLTKVGIRLGELVK